MSSLIEKAVLEKWIDKELHKINSAYRAGWANSHVQRAILEGRQASFIILQEALKGEIPMIDKVDKVAP